MIHAHSDDDGLRRHVSISTLPRLTRAGTFEIETRLLARHIRHRVRKFVKFCKKLARAVGRIIKYLVFVPCLPNVCFFILADKVIASARTGSAEQTSDDVTYFPTPKHHGGDSVNVVIIETREVEG
ncbi:uncharacterized protein F4812DRAFT_464080 [Daldinia caldariorum]|uniref:uncharacterized protein n=1 Tax=Daldinia caldariorum TaxID=326644 RepID=UPI00200821ED|nr:uncharacterized protein F4812DRAFT_464080 [Daldinia caldariorum]KAI1463081.1 hypothetical protein F4812DRAFT_464080 [Daldinia caldariorum]